MPRGDAFRVTDAIHGFEENEPIRPGTFLVHLDTFTIGTGVATREVDAFLLPDGTVLKISSRYRHMSYIIPVGDAS